MRVNPWPLFTLWSAMLLSSNIVQAADNGPVIPLPSEDQQVLRSLLGKGVVGDALPAPDITDTDRYLATHLTTRVYRLVSGPDSGKTERHEPAVLKRDAGGTSMRYDAGGKFVYFVTAKPNGDYVITGVEDRDGGAITRYSPSEPFMLEGLKPGDERKVTLGVKVFDLSSPDDLNHQGALDVAYRYIGAYKVKVPAGSFDAVLMKWAFKGKVGPASVDDTQYRFIAKDVGIVAGIEQLDVSAMLVYNRHTKVAKVLAAKPK